MGAALGRAAGLVIIFLVGWLMALIIYRIIVPRRIRAR